MGRGLGVVGGAWTWTAGRLSPAAASTIWQSVWARVTNHATFYRTFALFINTERKSYSAFRWKIVQTTTIES